MRNRKYPCPLILTFSSREKEPSLLFPSAYCVDYVSVIPAQAGIHLIEYMDSGSGAGMTWSGILRGIFLFSSTARAWEAARGKALKIFLFSLFHFEY